MTQVDVEGTNLDVEATFCYLVDMLCFSEGGDGACGKFRKLLPVLTSRHLSPKVWDKEYTACVCSALLHGNETWGPNTSKRLHYNDRTMIRWIRGTKDRDEASSGSLLQKLCIKDIAVLHSSRLRWHGHVQHATPCIKSVAYRA